MESTPPDTIYSFIINQPNEPRFLVFRTDNGFVLPSARLPHQWLNEVVGEACTLIQAQLGLNVTLLRSLSDGPHQLAEMELHGEYELPATTQWLDHDKAQQLILATPNHYPALQKWLAEYASEQIPPQRPAWEHRGWYGQAVTWITMTLAAQHISVIGQIRQVKAAWEWSCVLRVPTTQGDVYFKADYARPPAEPTVIDHLQRVWPRAVPRLLAIDSEQRWMLMPAFEGSPLDGQALWAYERAVQLSAAIQRAGSTELATWQALGCDNFHPIALVERFAQILGDAAVLGLDTTDGLSSEEHKQLQVLLPTAQQLAEQLMAYRIPCGPVQFDFRPGNIVISNDGCLIYDWSAVFITHPFFNMPYFLNNSRPLEPHEVSVEQAEELVQQRKEHLKAMYLAQWSDLEPLDRLESIWQIIEQLTPIYAVVQSYSDITYLEPGTTWHRFLTEQGVAQLLKWAIATLSPTA